MPYHDPPRNPRNEPEMFASFHCHTSPPMSLRPKGDGESSISPTGVR